jgi:hypothetical protein
MIPLQGKLKSIDKTNFDKLKRSLVKDGLPLGFHVWLDKDKTYICDGHHRIMAMKELRDEGYHIPSLPCTQVIAKDKKEAARAVLISNSRYAEMSQESLSDFMIEYDLQLDDIINIDIPELNTDFDTDDDDNDFHETNGSIPEDIKKNYSDKISTPIYSPKKDHAPNLHELFSVDKYNELVNEINNKDISEEAKLFLIHAASRHIIFNYENIAEFYCHQNKGVQDLMEKSALIIIDFSKAVENGFVRLTEELNNIYDKQEQEIDEKGE